MNKRISLTALLLALMAAGPLTGQVGPRQGLRIVRSLPAPPQPQVKVYGAAGSTTYTYFVTSTQTGFESTAGSATITNAPASPSTGDAIGIFWQGQAGADSYRVYKVTGTAEPASGSNLLCATSATYCYDTGQALSPGFPPATPPPADSGIASLAPDLGAQVYNVKAYGARGDDKTDDSRAFQSALDAMPSCSVGAGTWPHCGIVYAPPGVYLINELITMDAGETLAGAGPLATLLDFHGTVGAISYTASTFNTGPGAQTAGGINSLSINIGNAGAPNTFGLETQNTIGFQARELVIYDSAEQASSNCWWWNASGGDFNERYNVQAQLSNCHNDLYITNNNSAAGATFGYGTLNLNLQTDTGQFGIYLQGNGASSPVKINQSYWKITDNISNTGACVWGTNYTSIAVDGLLECEQTSGTGGHGVFSDANSSFRIDNLNLSGLTTPIQGGIVSSRQGYVVTFANLPAASSANEGWTANISDSTVATFGSTAAGGGTNHVQVRSNGTAWQVN